MNDTEKQIDPIPDEFSSYQEAAEESGALKCPANMENLLKQVKPAVFSAFQRTSHISRWFQPSDFFTILKETLDLILARFEGLEIEREVPCICHWQRETDAPCPRFYRYEDLVRRMENGRLTVECPDTLEDVSVPTLLYGIHASTEQQVLADIKNGQQKIQEQLEELQKLDVILEKLAQQSELIARNFTRRWNLEMKKIEAECPNTFILRPDPGRRFNPKNWISQTYLLYLVCQHPSGPYLQEPGYPLRQAEEWWVEISPWLGYLLKFLKYGLPVSKMAGLDDIAGLTEEAMKKMEEGVKLLEQINRLETAGSLKRVAARPQLDPERETAGPALRALHSFLNEVDPNKSWAGLHKTITPDGNILWLCAEHRQPYEVKPLEL